MIGFDHSDNICVGGPSETQKKKLTLRNRARNTKFNASSQNNVLYPPLPFPQTVP